MPTLGSLSLNPRKSPKTFIILGGVLGAFVVLSGIILWLVIRRFRRSFKYQVSSNHDGSGESCVPFPVSPPPTPLPAKLRLSDMENGTHTSTEVAVLPSRMKSRIHSPDFASTGRPVINLPQSIGATQPTPLDDPLSVGATHFTPPDDPPPAMPPPSYESIAVQETNRG
ncbi:hypothetical protein CVT24_011164 [Panaeolus cyanescens]|uniref:Uncharacterized protein n=1 Tax=Panaeolus cyanescens TaxID=181874 RepID=A0A409YGH1_9AGAR|nr:hypothetical protein CVT24_011164 [Panaeolus cyanescens]